MHLKRQAAITKLPIPRKGTKYVARSLSNISSSVPVVIAVRDMLKIARTAAEVKKMINEKLLTINGRAVKDHRESIQIFNILGAGKNYFLTFLPTGKFVFHETKSHDIRLCKVINKKLLKKNKIQLNLHDGSNIMSDKKISVGDSLLISFKGEIKEHLPFEKGKDVFVISGKYAGLKGKIKSIENEKVDIILENKNSTILNKYQVIVQ